MQFDMSVELTRFRPLFWKPIDARILNWRNVFNTRICAGLLFVSKAWIVLLVDVVEN